MNRLHPSSWSFSTVPWQKLVHTDAGVKNPNCPVEEGTRVKHRRTVDEGRPPAEQLQMSGMMSLTTGDHLVALW